MVQQSLWLLLGCFVFIAEGGDAAQSMNECSDEGSLLQKVPPTSNLVADIQARAIPSPPLPPSPDPWFIGNFSECRIGDGSDCAVGDLPGPTLVYPGGDAVCFDGSPYAFIVVPGASDKMLFMFQGGGQCWEAAVPGGQPGLLCQQTLEQAVSKSCFKSGIIDFTDKRNAFAEHTLVYLMYCSGDSFFSNRTWSIDGTPVYQKGYVNSLAAVTWATRFLDPTLSQLTITGFSAGSMAVMAWSDKLLSTFAYDSAAVLADSEVNSVPMDLAVELFQFSRMGICDTLGGGVPLCPNLRLQDFFLSTIRKYPHVPFSHVESKQDQRQTFFYNNVGQSLGLKTNITGAEFYATTIKFFTLWWSEPNYIAYFTNGDQHCPTVWLTDDTYYTTTPDGPGTIDSSTGTPLWRWVSDFVAGQPLASVCSGPVVADVSTNPNGCSQALPPKVLKLK